MQGNYRRKTRAQAQETLTFTQKRFDGGLNVDTPASQIAPNEMSEVTNLIAFREYLQGHPGKRTYSTVARPGTGAIWSELQHPVTKRVLMHRGGQLWLSSDSALTSWAEVTSIGPDGSLSETGTFTDGIYETEVTLSLRGLTLENTDEWELWWDVVVSGASSIYSVNIYKDAAKTQRVAYGSSPVHNNIVIAPDNNSGISGFVGAFVDPDTNGVYPGTPLIFALPEIDINFGSEIDAFGNFAFIIFVRGESPRTVFVDQRVSQYWFLSTASGYGDTAMFPDDSGDYRYRYLYTFSRIVNLATGAPEPTANRVSASLQLEGPSAVLPINITDYAVRSGSEPVSGTFPITVLLYSDGGLGPGLPIFTNAASYITHISIYRTKDVGVNGVTVDGLVNNPELYVWVADVPIYSTSYTDTTTDTILQNRAQNQYQLKSRFFQEMARGVGAIGPDFMYTAAPDTARITFCDAGLANPRFIGFYRPDIQFLDVHSPIVQILRPRNMFVIISKSYTMTSTSGIYDNGGNPLVGEFIPTVRDLEPSSETIGLTNPDSYCFLSETDFAGFCSDETIRVFSNGRWGESIDANRVHSLVGASRGGLTMGYVRGALYAFFRYDADAEYQDQCLRFGFGGFAGYNWSLISRDSWLLPPSDLPLLRLVDETGVLRLVSVDEDGRTYAIEDDEDQRQWVDDCYGIFLNGTASTYLSNLEIAGWNGTGVMEIRIQPYTGSSGSIQILLDSVLVAEGFFTIDDQPVIAFEVPESGSSGISATVDIDGWVDQTATAAVLTFQQFEYPTFYKTRDMTGTRLHNTVDHMESHIDLEPIPLTEIPDGFYMSIQGYADGAASPGAVVTNAPYNGDLQFRAPVSGRRIQIEYATNSARFRITEAETEYAQRDMVSPTGPSDTPEYVYQAELEASFTQWVSRPITSLNGANGLSYVPTGTPPEMVEDPTGAQFALRFTPSQSYAQEALTHLSGNYTLMGWFIPNSTTPTLCSFSGANALTLRASGAALILPNGNTIPYVFTGDWKHVAIVRQSGIMSVYVNGILAAAPVADATNYGGTAFTIGAFSFDVFDLRVYTNAKSYGAITYYVNNILTNNGRKVLSVFN